MTPSALCIARCPILRNIASESVRVRHRGRQRVLATSRFRRPGLIVRLQSLGCFAGDGGYSAHPARGAVQLFAAADRVPFVGTPLPRLVLRGFGCQLGRHMKARGG